MPPFLIFQHQNDLRQIDYDGTNYRIFLKLPEDTSSYRDNFEQARNLLAYDSVTDMLYFVRRNIIYKTTIDKPEVNIQKRTKHTENIVAISIDWHHRNLFFADDKGFIYRIGTERGEPVKFLDGRIRRVSETITGLAVYPQGNLLFISSNFGLSSNSLDTGKHGKILSYRAVQDVTLDYVEKRVYWTEKASHPDVMTDYVKSANLDGSDEINLTERQNIDKGLGGRGIKTVYKNPFSIAVFEDFVWISDVGKRALARLHKWNPSVKVRTLAGGDMQPTALVIVHSLIQPGANPCLVNNGDCDQKCHHYRSLKFEKFVVLLITKNDTVDCLWGFLSVFEVFYHLKLFLHTVLE